jgi:hypothetical protein
MNAPHSAAPTANHHIDEKNPLVTGETRRTVIPAPRSRGIFQGWGVKV